MSLVLLLVGFGGLRADTNKPKAKPERRAETTRERAKAERPRDGLIVRLLHLMPPGCAEELELTAEQRRQIAQLEREFQPKRREALLKAVGHVVSIVDSITNDRGEQRETAPVLAILHEVTGGLLESRHLRADYEQKMLGLLDDEQRERYAEFKERGPRERRERRQAREWAGKRIVHEERLLASPRADRRLQLTSKQKQQVADLQREWDTKMRSILTPEQLRMVDGLKRGRVQESTPRDEESEDQE
jgi:Spy/CpxP family protein refolding chaperone